MSDFKNESLFTPRLSEAEARETVAYALKMGWAHLPEPCATIPRAPAQKKKLLVPIMGGMENVPVHITGCVQSDVPPPQ